MDHMTDMQISAEHGITKFYDTLATDYDAMTGFEQRFVKERPFFRLLVERYGIRTALDAGCGTGFHSLLLARLGVQVTALDISPKMLAVAGRHAKEMELDVHFVEGSFHALPRIAPGPYDAIFSLGNSLAHLLTKTDLARLLAAFTETLSPRGILFLQNLNYDRIMVKKERIQNIKEQDDTTFIRSYEYDDDLIHFNILKKAMNGPEAVQHSTTITLRPVMQKELTELLHVAGFGEVKSYGSISMEGFRSTTSHDLVVLARKKASA
jgi:2-polyprenyl-3-methyl-5-hydroxy-6-metoxy-1,4-benzoquinol methylase